MRDTEADTCRKYVLQKLYAAGWTDEQINEQHTFTDGTRILPTSGKIRRRKQKRADYRLRIARNFSIAVVEAKASYKTAGDGLQQAKDYAEILDLKFAYATNGTEIIEFDYLTGKERIIETFPTPDELWARLRGVSPIENDEFAGRGGALDQHPPDDRLRIGLARIWTRVIFVCKGQLKGRPYDP